MENYKEKMNIVLCTDGGYIEPCCTAIESVIQNNSEFFVTAFIIVSDLQPKRDVCLKIMICRSRVKSLYKSLDERELEDKFILKEISMSLSTAFDSPLISIVVPVYKVEPFLQECIDSVLNQSFKDFE